MGADGTVLAIVEGAVLVGADGGAIDVDGGAGLEGTPISSSEYGGGGDASLLDQTGSKSGSLRSSFISSFDPTAVDIILH